jgi:sugar phosphate isomerase/epimerase
VKLGIGAYCYMWSIGFGRLFPQQPQAPITALGLLDKARELGVKVVQYGPNHPFASYPAAEVAAIARQAREWGIELELATRGLEAAHLEEQIEVCHRLGAKLLRTIPELTGANLATKDIPSYCNAVLPSLIARGVKLGLENGKIPAVEMREVIEKIANPLVGIVLDTANSMAVPEGYKHVVEVLAPYTNCLHHKEFIVLRAWSMMGFVVEGRPAGQGQVDTPWLLETVRKAGAQCNCILEAWPPYQGTLQGTVDLEQQWVVESVRYLRTLIPD